MKGVSAAVGGSLCTTSACVALVVLEALTDSTLHGYDCNKDSAAKKVGRVPG